jgi:hypothetical protein
VRRATAGARPPTTASTLSVQVCAARLPYDVEPKAIWCAYSRVKIAAHGKTFVRTGPHGCTPGVGYFSYVRILGYEWDRGPFTICR